MSRTSQGGHARQFHPLLREFLLRKLSEELPPEEIAQTHSRVARAAEGVDLIAACHHYIEADEPAEGMRCLAESVIQTIGSGRWGAAFQLIDRLDGIHADPAVLAIQARRLIEEGHLRAATGLLSGVDTAGLPPMVRAVIRLTRVSLGWRCGDSAMMLAALREVSQDDETPVMLREIAQIFIDTSPMTIARPSLHSVSHRLRRMATAQAASGNDYYAAISLHNAAVASLNSGNFTEAIGIGYEATDAYDHLAFPAVERYSVHALIATASFELGRIESGREHIRIAIESDEAEGDVHAELAHTLAVAGDRTTSTYFLERAEALDRMGRLDLEGRRQAALSRSLLMMPAHPYAAIQLLQGIPSDAPLDLGYTLLATVLTAMAHLLLEDDAKASSVADSGRPLALAQGNRRCQARLDLIWSLASGDSEQVRGAISQAEDAGNLAILEVADAIAPRLNTLWPIPAAITNSISRWPDRWLPVLRRQLDGGNTAAGHTAAELIDAHGTSEDIGRLRAYDRTYRRRGKSPLGRLLARRVSPVLEIGDLGRGMLRIGSRAVPINNVRRKPASLLLYLVTRPNFTATREQVLEDLWPDGDPESGANSLNQSLYFLRREIDPWYEVDVSPDYVAFEAELVWLDAELVRVASANFLNSVQQRTSETFAPVTARALVAGYGGQFCPEFEYDDWAMAWRSRVHAAYLDFAHGGIEQLVDADELSIAREIASMVLSVDPSAADIERKLIWLYARLGSASAAEAQYQHLAGSLRADGLPAPSLSDVTATPRPR